MVGGPVKKQILYQYQNMFAGGVVVFFVALPTNTADVLGSSLPVPPSIAEGRDNVTVTVNVQTTLSCEATGIPRPAVSWAKNGRAINTDQNQNMYR